MTNSVCFGHPGSRYLTSIISSSFPAREKANRRNPLEDREEQDYFSAAGSRAGPSDKTDNQRWETPVFAGKRAEPP